VLLHVTEIRNLKKEGAELRRELEEQKIRLEKQDQNVDELRELVEVLLKKEKMATSLIADEQKVTEESPKSVCLEHHPGRN